jgi:hypothetical protein
MRKKRENISHREGMLTLAGQQEIIASVDCDAVEVGAPYRQAKDSAIAT